MNEGDEGGGPFLHGESQVAGVADGDNHVFVHDRDTHPNAAGQR